MRDDLQLLASHAGVALSPFAREVLIGALPGRGSLPERLKIARRPSAATLAWNLDEKVKVTQIDEADSDSLGEAERAWLAEADADEFDK